MGQGQHRGLVDYLQAGLDPRGRQGRQCAWGTLLVLVAAAGCTAPVVLAILRNMLLAATVARRWRESYAALCRWAVAATSQALRLVGWCSS
ncbi:MAG: hypothetical protein IT204_19210 [Fimbriimonadaceae bacterium]|nr:hypothetical protein [Fimbriimonadaceae bacterium]